MGRDGEKGLGDGAFEGGGFVCFDGVVRERICGRGAGVVFGASGL